MSVYNNTYNYSDVDIRHIIASVAEALHNKIQYEQVRDEITTIIKVPFYNSMTGSEDYLYNNYMYEGETSTLKQIPTFVGVVPRGVITLDSINIESSNITNKTVRLEMLKKENNINKMFSYEVLTVPLILSFTAKIITNSYTEMLKIFTHGILKSLYKNLKFDVNISGNKLVGSIAIQESQNFNKMVEFSYSDKTELSIDFSFDVSISYPIVDEDSKLFVGDKIEKFEYTINIEN